MFLKKILQNIVGSENVSDEEVELICYSRDASPTPPAFPLCIVRPQSAEQISEILKLANRKKIPVVAQGAATNYQGALSSTGAIILDMRSMDDIINIDEENQVVTVESGITWGKLLSFLHKKGWETGPVCHDVVATLGGAVALCSDGINSAKYGLIGDQVIGLEAVLPNGEKIRTGSGANPNAKQFCRYCYASDLTGLFIGSHGVFGIVTEVSLKIYPLPEAQSFHGYMFNTLEAATKAMWRIQKRHLPIESMTLEYGVRVAKNFPEIEADAVLAPIVISGSNEEVKAAEKTIEQISLEEGKKLPMEIIEKAKESYRKILRYSPSHKSWGKYVGMGEVNLLSMPLTSNLPTLDIPKIVHVYKEICNREGLPFGEFSEEYRIITHFRAYACKDYVISTPGLYYDGRDKKSRQKAYEFARRATVALMEHGAVPHYLGRTMGPPEAMWKLGVYFDLLKKLKKTIDPNNILNPGTLELIGYR